MNWKLKLIAEWLRQGRIEEDILRAEPEVTPAELREARQYLRAER